jgi:molybdate transport system regulatory protein
LKVRFKIWTEIEGRALVGPGRFQLLSALRRTGSINAAASDAGISYRRAWGQIREMERLLGQPLIVSNRGGKSGGGTELTAGAKKLIEDYEKLRRRVNKAIKASGAVIPDDEARG